MKIFTMKLFASTAAIAALLLSGCDLPPQETVQRGYRGTGMEAVYSPEALEEIIAANQVPAAIPAVSSEGPKAADIYQNVEVLGHLSVGEFTRLMAAITQWVSPDQGCNYCHVPGEGFEQDTLYTKKVARVMIAMTQNANQNWGAHVGGAGVTCYTCHRGNNVPEQVWTIGVPPRHASGHVHQMQNVAHQESSVFASLPIDPFTPYLLEDGVARDQGDTALPQGHEASIQSTEHVYSLMMHYSDALGVNCTHCHNSRAFGSWEESNSERVKAWHGQQMVKQMNNDYINPTNAWLPAYRQGPLGDAQKVNCATCHQGAYQPLLGANMLADYPNLGSLAPAPTDLVEEAMDAMEEMVEGAVEAIEGMESASLEPDDSASGEAH
jgi:photosynthetic reaction center cytochrome c subunit